MSEFTFLRGPADWWRQAVVYQIYPRSFADRNGDGIGDFPGIIERLPYLAALGIDAVWLSPFYPSELADGGYDVADWMRVNRPDVRVLLTSGYNDELVDDIPKLRSLKMLPKPYSRAQLAIAVEEAMAEPRPH